MSGALFDFDRPANEWIEFEAEGFDNAVTGVIYRSATPVRGIPLGGIGTGYMHLGPDGLLDRGTAFNSFLPPGGSAGFSVSRKDFPSYDQPFLGLTTDNGTWILALPRNHSVKGWTALIDQSAMEGYAPTPGGVSFARELHYWGHFPIADMEYEIAAPVRIGARVWTPFILGDEVASNTPGIVIEARVRNTTNRIQTGRLIINFPGFSETEGLLGFRGAQMGLRGSTEYPHSQLSGDIDGVYVHHEMKEYDHKIGYALGVIGRKPAAVGRDIGFDMSAWAAAGTNLPEVHPYEPGTAIAVDFSLEPSEIQNVHFVLSWFAPNWMARHGFLPKRIAGTNPYTHKYYERFKSEVEVARYLAAEHEELLRRVLAWQQSLYASKELPGWLQDSLINNFHIIAQNSFWAISRLPGHWAGSTGIFSMNESLPTCPQQQCIPCDFIANFPLLYFYPNLVHQSIRAFKARQKEDGEVPFIMGAGTELDDPCYGTQYSTDCQVFVHLVARIWQRTGDSAVLTEFYTALKKAIRFLESMDKDGDGIVDAWGGSWFYEGFPVKGASIFVATLWLSTLRLSSLMASEMGDDEFIGECESWYNRAARSVEELLWNQESGVYYLYHQPATDSHSEVILADQLVGEWICRFHGVENALPPHRVKQARETILAINAEGCEVGIRATMYPDRHPYQGGYVCAYSVITPAMLELYDGSPECGLGLVHRMWHHITCRKGWTWDHPSHFQSDGERMVGHEYYHNTMLWALPAAVLKQDLTDFCAPGGFVDRILQAANP